LWFGNGDGNVLLPRQACEPFAHIPHDHTSNIPKLHPWRNKLDKTISMDLSMSTVPPESAASNADTVPSITIRLVIIM
jgi:hypothetical protein